MRTRQWELTKSLCELGSLLRQKGCGAQLQAAFDRYSKALHVIYIYDIYIYIYIRCG